MTHAYEYVREQDIRERYIRNSSGIRESGRRWQLAESWSERQAGLAFRCLAPTREVTGQRQTDTCSDVAAAKEPKSSLDFGGVRPTSSCTVAALLHCLYRTEVPILWYSTGTSTSTSTSSTIAVAVVKLKNLGLPSSSVVLTLLVSPLVLGGLGTTHPSGCIKNDNDFPGKHQQEEEGRRRKKKRIQSRDCEL